MFRRFTRQYLQALEGLSDREKATLLAVLEWHAVLESTITA
jgi:hypothetical protein